MLIQASSVQLADTVIKEMEKKQLPSPCVTGVMPVKQLIVVVFPAPLGPRRQKS